MKDPVRLVLLAVVPFSVLAAAPAAQKVETVDGVRIVHNEKGGIWGQTPKVVLELVRKIGEILLAHFADVIRIAGDSLFLIDRERGVTVYQ